MKTVYTNSSYIQQAQNWIDNEPMQALVVGFVIIVCLCYGKAIKEALGG